MARSGTSRRLVAGLALAATVGLLWIGSGSIGGGPASAGAGERRSEPAREDPVLDDPIPGVSESQPATAPRDAASLEACTLHLLVREDGHQASGRVSWLQSRRSNDLTLGLACQWLPGSRDLPAAQHRDLVDGAADLDARAGEWLWLRLCSTAGRTVFDRIQPFRGIAEHTIELPRDPAIHVQVLAPDWWTPRPHASFSVLWGDPHTGTMEGHGTRVCDETGYAEVRDIPAGRIVLTAAGANPEDGAPFACPLVWDCADTDVSVLLVAPPTRQRLSLSVLVDDCEHMRVRPKLYLARVDGTRERLHPQRGTLHDGRQDLLFEVPEGVYEVGVLPLGELMVTGGRRVEVGTTAATASVTLTASREQTRVRLHGPRIPDFPLRVSVEAANGLRDDDPDTMFAGPFRWHGPEAELPSMADPCIVTAVGRQTAFVSGPTWFHGAAVDVDLRPACCLEVHWLGDSLALAEAPVLIVSSMGTDSARAFERKLVEGAGARRPAWVARIVVELGDVALTGMVGERVAWQRNCAALQRQMLVRIEDP